MKAARIAPPCLLFFSSMLLFDATSNTNNKNKSACFSMILFVCLLCIRLNSECRSDLKFRAKSIADREKR